MAHERTTFNACSYLMFCDETLVSMGYKISVLNEYASVHNLPKKKSSSDSLLSKVKMGKFGRDSPKTSRDKQKDSAEGSNTTNKNATEMADPSENSSSPNPKQSVKVVFEYEHVIEGFEGPEETAILNAVANEIVLDNDEVEGMVTLTLPRNGVNGDTPREM